MKFSVIIPTFNRRHQIGEAIDSVLSQQSVDTELVIVDDGSSDGTLAWLAANYPDPRIKVLTNTRKKGPAGARNSGLLAATGEVIAFLDSDDRFLPGHLLSCAQVLAQHPDVGVIFGRARYECDGETVDYMGPNFERKLSLAPIAREEKGVRIFSSDYFTHLLQYGCYFNLSTVVLRAAAAKQLMNEDLRIAEDYEYWVRLSRSQKFACLDQPQIIYQLHEQNISFEAASSAADNAPQLLKAYRIIASYPSLEKVQLKLINEHIATVLFDWGYRSRQRQRWRDAVSQHWQSAHYGRRLENLVALAKLLVISSLTSIRAER
jgi:glycosyltransferase involved in cell wall biosynthesis